MMPEYEAERNKFWAADGWRYDPVARLRHPSIADLRAVEYWKHQAEEESRIRLMYQERCGVLDDIYEDADCMLDMAQEKIDALVAERDEARSVAAGLLVTLRTAKRLRPSLPLGAPAADIRAHGEAYASLPAGVRKLVEG